VPPQLGIWRIVGAAVRPDCYAKLAEQDRCYGFNLTTGDLAALKAKGAQRDAAPIWRGDFDPCHFRVERHADSPLR
jgi:hypothetical protein